MLATVGDKLAVADSDNTLDEVPESVANPSVLTPYVFVVVFTGLVGVAGAFWWLRRTQQRS